MSEFEKVIGEIEACDNNTFASFAFAYIGEERLMDLIRDSLEYDFSEDKFQNLSAEEIKNKIGFVYRETGETL